jgi:hypothetical protein
VGGRVTVRVILQRDLVVTFVDKISKFRVHLVIEQEAVWLFSNL